MYDHIDQPTAALTSLILTGLLAVVGFTWDLPDNLSVIDDLPEGTQMMARGPDGRSIVTQDDYEAFQVARWALSCFVQSSVPLTHPGGRGSWDAMPTSVRDEGGEGWTYAYVFQRLLEIAALHPAIQNVDSSAGVSVVPERIRAATSQWRARNEKLFSFCFRLHSALVEAGATIEGMGPWAVITTSERQSSQRVL
jgi:hypothetical protein